MGENTPATGLSRVRLRSVTLIMLLIDRGLERRPLALEIVSAPSATGPSVSLLERQG